MPSSYSQSSVPLRQAHQNGTLGFTGFDEPSQAESALNPDPSTMFDEPPPPYPHNTLLVSPLSDVFPPSSLLSTDLLNVGPITPSPLAPVPLRHSSLYQVLKHDTPALPGQGTVQSGVSSIAHALQPQELPARQALPIRTPVLGNTRSSTIGASESALAATQVASTSPAAVVVDLCSTLPQIPTVAPSARAQRPVSSATPPCAPVPQAENGSVVTPLGGHTLALSLPEVTIHDYDTLPRLRKLQPALPGSAKEDQSAASSPLSPLSSRPSSSMGAPAASARDSKSALESAFTLPLLGRKRPVLRAKLACLFCRRRKIQCRPVPGDHQDHSCQQCAKRSRQCEYPEMTWRGRGRKRSRPELEESDCEYEEEEELEGPSRMKTRRDT
ncbi:hypothetical protein BC826DRAFT_1192045 [Russula brevipes]|nr:hypothetical protein BC826DRAFT_1192045 [Russula brevipes]